MSESVKRQDILVIREEQKLDNKAEKSVIIILLPVVGAVRRQFYMGLSCIFISSEQR